MPSLSIIVSFQYLGAGKWENLELSCIFTRIMTFHIAKHQVRIIRCHRECGTMRNVPWPDFFLASAWSSENHFLHVIQAVNCFLQPVRSVRSNSYNLSNSIFKTKQHSIPYMWDLKAVIQINIFTKQTYLEGKLMVLSGVGIVRESGMDMDRAGYL